VIEDNLPSVEVTLAELKIAWEETSKTEENFRNCFEFKEMYI